MLVYAGVDTPRWWDIALLYGSLLYIGHFLGTSQRLRGTWIERCWNGIVRVVSGALEAIMRSVAAVIGAPE